MPRPRPRSTPLALALALALPLPLLAPGCVAAAVGAGMGFVVSQEVLPNQVHTARVTFDVDHVWEVSRDVLDALSLEPLEIQDYPRVAVGEVDGAEVRVEVYAYDLDETEIRVDAKKYLVHQGETAGKVMRRILDRLAK